MGDTVEGRQRRKDDQHEEDVVEGEGGIAEKRGGQVLGRGW